MSSYGNIHIPNEAQQEQKAKAAYEENQRALAETISVKDGKLFGYIPVAPEFERTVNLLLAPLTAWLSKSASDFVYKQTKSIAEGNLVRNSLPEIASHSHTIATRAQLATMWSILALRPISEFVGANKNYTMQRIALGRDVHSTCEATGAIASKNEVVKAAYNDLHQHWIEDLKMLIPGLLVFSTQIPLGLKMQDKILDSQKHQSDLDKLISEGRKAKPGKTEKDLIAEAMAAQRKAEAEAMRDARKTFFEANPGLRETDAGERQFERYLDRISKTPESKIDPKTAHGHGKNPMGDATHDMLTFGGFSAAAGMLGPDLQRAMQNKKQGEKKNSYDRIKDLREKAQGGRSNRNQIINDVVEIFQQLEVDMGRTRFAGGLADQLQVAVTPIAEAIAEGRLDALMLVQLAGESQVVEHRGSNRQFKGDAEIQKALQKAIGTQVREDSEVSAETFLGAFENQQLAKETVRKNLDELKGDERNLFVSILPIEILVAAGMDEKEIRGCRRCAHERLYDQAAAAVIHVAAESDDMLRKRGISSKDIAAIKALSKKVEHEMKSPEHPAIETLVDGADKSLLSTVAGALLSEQISGNKAVWTERIKESKSLDQTVESIKAEKENQSAEGHSHVERESIIKPSASHAKREIHKHSGDPNLHVGV